jgi:hypothetical protein
MSIRRLCNPPSWDKALSGKVIGSARFWHGQEDRDRYAKE